MIFSLSILNHVAMDSESEVLGYGISLILLNIGMYVEIPETVQSATGSSQEIPAWIKNNADWWSQGLISDGDFLKGIQFMVENGIIAV